MEYDIPFMMRQAHMKNKERMLMKEMYFTNIEWGFRLGFISLEDFKERSEKASEIYRPKSWREYLEE